VGGRAGGERSEHGARQAHQYRRRARSGFLHTAAGRARADVAVTSPIITEAMRALVERKDLSRIEAAGAMEAIMSGAATDAQIAAFLTALRMKGETVEELIGFAQVMRQKVVKVRTRGIKIELSPAKIARCVEEIGIGFLYAPLLHTAMKHVMTARREMGVRTVFNLLGPLTNPAGANAQVIGVSSESFTEPLARVLA